MDSSTMYQVCDVCYGRGYVVDQETNVCLRCPTCEGDGWKEGDEPAHDVGGEG